MIKQTVKYTDFDGKEVTEDLYFHLSKTELIDWYALEGEDFPDRLTALVESGNVPRIIAMFKLIVGKGYGTRVEGSSSRFKKSDDQTNEFLSSPAFDALIFDLMTDEKRAVTFFNGMFPADLVAQAADQVRAASVRPMRGVAGPEASGSEPGIGTGIPQEMSPERVVELSGLAHPFGRNDAVLAWAFREPTDRDLAEMTKPQMGECMQRKMRGWEPPADI